ncbi:MAG: hypothetical protein AAFR12_08430 [Cyanobacteria bacterium J06626_6]
MPLPSKPWLPLVLVTSPLLLAATHAASPDAGRLSCELSEDLTTHTYSAHSSELQPTLTPTENIGAHPIVHPVGSRQQALVTAEREWLAFDSAQAPTSFHPQSNCRIKEEPTEAPSAPLGEPADDLPNLDPAVSPLPSAPQPETRPNADPTPPTPTADPATTDPSPTVEDVPESAPPASPPAAPLTIPTRPVTPPPGDPGIDPTNFTPETAAPTPFDGIVVPPLAALPDGSYRYLAGNYEFGNYTNGQLIANGGSIFLLTKTGNQVIGELRPRLDQPGICVSGTVSGNSITGSAYPQSTEAETSADGETEVNGEDEAEAEATVENDTVGETYQPYTISALQIRQPRTVAGRTYYAGALLDLSEYSRINAGTALAPTSCEIPSTDDSAANDPSN